MSKNLVHNCFTEVLEGAPSVFKSLLSSRGTVTFVGPLFCKCLSLTFPCFGRSWRHLSPGEPRIKLFQRLELSLSIKSWLIWQYLLMFIPVIQDRAQALCLPQSIWSSSQPSVVIPVDDAWVPSSTWNTKIVLQKFQTHLINLLFYQLTREAEGFSVENQSDHLSSTQQNSSWVTFWISYLSKKLIPLIRGVIY